MGMKQESSLVPIKCSAKATHIFNALDRIGDDYGVEIIRDELSFDDEHTIIDLSAILNLVTKLAVSEPTDDYTYVKYGHLFGDSKQLKLF